MNLKNTSLLNRVLAGIVIAGLILAHVSTLTIYPQPSCDEATYASNADSFLQSGRFGLTVYTQGDSFGRDQNMVHHGRLHILGEALLFQFFGIKWEVARLYALLGLAVTVWLTFVLGRQLYSTKVGVMAAIMLAVAVKSFLSGQQGRPETWTIASILLAALALWQMLQKPESWRRAILAGLLGVVPFDFHGNGLWFLAGFGALLIIECLLLQRQWVKFCGYVSGVGSGVGLWLIAHLLPEPGLAWYQMTTGYRLLGNSPAAHGLLYNLQITLDWIKDSFGVAYGPLGLIELLLLGIGLVGASRQFDAAARFVATLLFVSALGFSAGMSQKFPQYAFLWLPFIYLLGFATLSTWFSSRQFRFNQVALSGQKVFVFIVAGIALLNLAGGLWLGFRFRNGQPERLNAELLALAPRGSRVLASQVWWWALRADRTFISDEYIALPFIYPGKPANLSTQQLVDQTIVSLRPDFIVLGRALACYNQPDDTWQALQTYATKHCTAIADLRSPWADDPGKWFTYLGQSNTIYKC